MGIKPSTFARQVLLAHTHRIAFKQPERVELAVRNGIRRGVAFARSDAVDRLRRVVVRRYDRAAWPAASSSLELMEGSRASCADRHR